MGRPRTCECGTCAKCKHRDYMREYYYTSGRITYVKPENRRRYETWRYHTDAAYRMRKKARIAVNQLVHRGKLKRGDCTFCGQPHANAHHNDYTKPLDVTWLCPAHHDLIHTTLPAT